MLGAVLLVLRLRLAKIAHAIAQGVQRLGLTIQRLRQIAVAQRLFGIIHGASGPVQLAAALLAFGVAGTGQLAAVLQLIQLALQIALPFGKALAIALLLAALAVLLLAIGAVLQVAKAVIGQLLLVAQGLAQILHRLVAGVALTAALPVALGHLHVVHEVAQLVHQFLRLGGPALFHQLLQLVQHLVQLVLRHLHSGAVLRGFGIVLGPVLFGLLTHVIVQRVLHFLHQIVDLGRCGPVLDGFVHPVLGAFQPFQRRGEVAFLDHQGNLPQLFGHLVAGVGVKRGARSGQAARSARAGADRPFRCG